MARLLLLWNDLGNRDQDLNRQESDAVLIVLGKVLEHGYHLFHNNRSSHLLQEFRKVGCRLPAHHGRLVVD
jgi:hypothetical protein